MGLLSNLKRRAEPASSAAPAGEPADAVQKARTRARQRLIGAVVLVTIGVIGFPLVFESQPRPIPVDIPIEVPRKDTAAPLVMPATRAPTPVASAPVAAASAERPPDATDVITESRADAGRELAASAAAPAPVAPAPKPKVATAEPAPKPAPEPKAAVVPTDSVRAKALLEDKPAPSADGARFVVQVGAFADAGAARETRAKAEKLGLKTYTQVASTSAGHRIRVRVGPFATRDEADKALAKARASGLTAVVLTL